MYLLQEGKCKGCDKESNRTLNVDHDHETGKIRGLLCGNCNRGIGLLGDNIETLQNLIKYLEESKMILPDNQ